MDLETALGDRVRQLRQKHHWTQDDLGRRLGVHQTTVAKLEAGGRPIRVNELGALARIFEVPLADLLSDAPLAAAKRPPRRDLDRRVASAIRELKAAIKEQVR